MIGMVVGSSVGGFVPMLWGADFLSPWGILFSVVGGVLGIWGGYKLSE